MAKELTEAIPQTLQSNKLVLNGKVYSVDKTWTEVKPDVTFKDKETEQSKTAHKTVLSQASPFFTAWFKEQWKQDKLSDEYPLPGDIDWEVFTTIISILYGEEVEFEEEALPDLFRAADYLQLDILKVAIVVSLTDKWQVKSEPLLLSMCTAVASQADKNILSCLLYMATLSFLIQNLLLLVKSGSEVIPTLPYGTIVEISQSEEVTAPEIELYHFLRIWCEGRKKEVTLEQMEDIFSQIRYATIPNDGLEKITIYSTYISKNFWSAFSTCPKFDAKVEINTEQFTVRRCQQPVLLLNSPKQKKWTKSILMANDTGCYSVVSSKKHAVIVVSWSSTKSAGNGWSAKMSIHCHISNFESTDKKKGTLNFDTKKLSEDTVFPTCGMTIETTATGIVMTAQGADGNSTTVTYDQPCPWLLTIERRMGLFAMQSGPPIKCVACMQY